MFFEKNKLFIVLFLYYVCNKLRINKNYFVTIIVIDIQFNIINYMYFCFKNKAIKQTLSIIKKHKFLFIKNFMK